MIPEKLQIGDEVRIIAPARSLQVVSEDNIQHSIKILEEIGLNISFGRHVYEKDMMLSSSKQSRLEDLHEAFADKNIKAILTVLGGYNSNQLLEEIDYGLIAKNPKILCGFSDITALSNAIYAKTGLVGYSGPHFSTFAMQKGLEYTKQYFKKALFEEGAINIESSKQWSSDATWYLDQENRTFQENPGIEIIHSGYAEGKIIGGNLGTLQLLRGTSYMPSLYGVILFLEEVANHTNGLDVFEFERNLESLTQAPDFEGVQAIAFGRFETNFRMTKEKLIYIIETKIKLRNIPIISNVDFGHSTPIITFPVGGWCQLSANAGKINLIIADQKRAANN